MVDYSSFVFGLRSQGCPLEYIGLEKREVGVFPCHIDARYVHQFRKPTMALWIRTAIATLLTPRQLHERDQAFQDARQQILAAGGPGFAHKKLQISMALAPGSGMIALVNFVRTAPPPPAEYPLGQVVLDNRISTKKQCEQEVADLVTCLNDKHKRVRLGLAHIDVFEKVEEADEATYGDLMAACFQPEGISQSAEGQEDVTPRASITAAICTNHQLVTQLCSAVMSARGVESLALFGLRWIRNSRRDRLRFMGWIVLSLFSNLARHSIHQLHLERFYLSVADMENLEAFLLSTGDNQLSALRRGLLCGEEQDHEDQGEAVFPSRNQIFLAEGTQVWLDSFSTRSAKATELKRGCWADVVVDDGGDPTFYDTLVPGYGWCEVRSADTQAHRTIDQAPDVGRLVNHGITSLTLTLQEPQGVVDCSGYGRFLHLVRAPLEELKIHNVGDFTPHLRTIWAVCSLLRHLELWDVSPDVLRSIADAYESGNCLVSRLTVRYLERSRGSQDVVIELCEQLCDPERVISKTLTELCLGVGYDGATDEELTSMVKMLEHNRTLISLTVTVRDSQCYLLVTQLMAKNNQPLPVRGAPLPIRAKLAFISAVDSSGSAGTATAGSNARGAIGSLDCDVISRSFETAAAPIRRKVILMRVP